MKNSFGGIANIKDNEYSYHSFDELLDWIDLRKNSQHVSIDMISLSACSPWYYDEKEGMIRNRRGSFFQIAGIRGEYDEGQVVEQPIILQKEIGFLGIVCKKIKGIWHFLMQAKIEPGNLNYVQISPTLQATMSNFSRQHGGSEPAYLDLFTHMKRKDILVDQIQSEQSSRFFGKRNRNVIIKTDLDLMETDSHRWVTLTQLEHLMRINNLINMDTRTVLSCLPYVFIHEGLTGYSDEFIHSIRKVDHAAVVEVFLKMNNIKMFHSPKVAFLPLFELPGWEMENKVFRKKSGYPFEIIFSKIEIDSREVTKWNQPLFAAMGMATFGLICSEDSGSIEVLVHFKSEIGCFDTVELGPTVQEEYNLKQERDAVEELFFQWIGEPEKVRTDVVLSEEGGRFYHEQNRNVIMFVDKSEVPVLTDRYAWVSFGTLNSLAQVNNCLNIQLRNLLVLLAMNN